MKAIYEFEEELLKDYDFEPMNEGYNIDDLSNVDRQQLSGMLWILYSTIKRWEMCCEEKYGEFPETFKKMATELLSDTKEELIQNIMMDIDEFVISCLDREDNK